MLSHERKLETPESLTYKGNEREGDAHIRHSSMDMSIGIPLRCSIGRASTAHRQDRQCVVSIVQQANTLLARSFGPIYRAFLFSKLALPCRLQDS
jgi:hypothetical protein